MQKIQTGFRVLNCLRLSYSSDELPMNKIYLLLFIKSDKF